MALLAQSLGLPEEVTARAMDRHRLRLALEDATLASLRETAEFLRGQGVIEALPDLRTVHTVGL